MAFQCLLENLHHASSDEAKKTYMLEFTKEHEFLLCLKPCCICGYPMQIKEKWSNMVRYAETKNYVTFVLNLHFQINTLTLE